MPGRSWASPTTINSTPEGNGDACRQPNTWCNREPFPSCRPTGRSKRKDPRQGPSHGRGTRSPEGAGGGRTFLRRQQRSRLPASPEDPRRHRHGERRRVMSDCLIKAFSGCACPPGECAQKPLTPAPSPLSRGGSRPSPASPSASSRRSSRPPGWRRSSKPGICETRSRYHGSEPRLCQTPPLRS
jgi:hypothetical protein